MHKYLDFKSAKCKDCYKCVRYCPVNAIKIEDYQAKIVSDRCILCGKCTHVCPQNAKVVHDSKSDIISLLKSKNCYASVAPSFASSFELNDFEIMKEALKKLGFIDAEETAVGAYVVSKEYQKMLQSGKYKNLISSACPAVNRMVELYYPNAIKYLAPVVTPMVAHAKIIKAREKIDNLAVIFIGPCIAKKREGDETDGIIDGVLTFEELNDMFIANNIVLEKNFKPETIKIKEDTTINHAKYYPIPRGIIKSFGGQFEKDYEYVAVDGINKCKDVLSVIDELDSMFLELNSCEYGCVNGPCSLIKKGTAVSANCYVRRYANQDVKNGGTDKIIVPEGIDFSYEFKLRKLPEREVTEEEIKQILARTNKFTPEDELNCGACGYDTCRAKAVAVAHGYADVEMCVPYMRDKAESMSYQIIQNMPNGIIVVDSDYKIRQINSRVSSMFEIRMDEAKGMYIFDLMDSAYFIDSFENKKNIYRKQLHIDKTNIDIELTIIHLGQDNAVFAVLKDITEKARNEAKMAQMKQNTLQITNEVIEKQMRVAQEIASVLGETVAETKVAIVNLRKSLLEEDKNKKGEKK